MMRLIQIKTPFAVQEDRKEMGVLRQGAKRSVLTVIFGGFGRYYRDMMKSMKVEGK